MTRVLPLSADLHAVPNPFVIYDDNPVDTETPSGAIAVHDEDEIARYIRTFETLRKSAADADETGEMLRQIY